MSLTFERYYPWIFGMFFVLIAWLQEWALPFSEENKYTALLSASISVSAILVGFLATMKSIMMALPGVIERLKTAGYLQIFSSYLIQGTITSLAFCVLNISFFFPKLVIFPVACTAAWIGIGVVSLLSFWRIVHVMSLIMRIKH